MHEYVRVPPPFCYKKNFICNLIHVARLDKGCDPKPWQKEVDDCLEQDEFRVQLTFSWVKSTSNFFTVII